MHYVTVFTLHVRARVCIHTHIHAHIYTEYELASISSTHICLAQQIRICQSGCVFVVSITVCNTRRTHADTACIWTAWIYFHISHICACLYHILWIYADRHSVYTYSMYINVYVHVYWLCHLPAFHAHSIDLTDSGRHPATVALPASRYPVLPDAAQQAALPFASNDDDEFENREAQVREMLILWKNWVDLSPSFLFPFATGESTWDPGVFTIIIFIFPFWWLSYHKHSISLSLLSRPSPRRGQHSRYENKKDIVLSECLRARRFQYIFFHNVLHVQLHSGETLLYCTEEKEIHVARTVLEKISWSRRTWPLEPLRRSCSRLIADVQVRLQLHFPIQYNVVLNTVKLYLDHVLEK